MSWHTHPEASAIVREHWHEAECFLVAQSKPCIEIRDDEIEHIDRLIHGGIPDDLEAWSRPRIWFIAVIVCPDDDLTPLTEYVMRAQVDPDRIHFYLHPDTNYDVFGPWAHAGLPLDRVDDEGKAGAPLSTWQALHGILGQHFNAQILHDTIGL